MQMITFSRTFQLRKRSPDIAQYRLFLSIHAYDEGLTFQADKRCCLSFQKLSQQNSSHSHPLTSNSQPG